ncbi:carboxypeptidase-like regulatory domain-containing protein [Myxococcus sp. RHSTA-1-4]|uniref:carboxypeptidase-like regulatory domain-containing protein n=1 Tax=Myxococcus sp. RHSTA-1-4 TaxID=2874601 RepID=UPI001CBB2966|nr:carboxypeptidase-like regulatory domain-containing protein [Myxococcus sp. RHSTA-1-4]MBZ4417474.1 carboxypeptidase regulatory-like domain-containing protein [Myxococcus sp. RHSTA-1-4]
MPTARASAAPAALRSGAGLSIRGTVVDSRGAPVAGVYVSASSPEPGQTLSELPCPEGSQEDYEDPRDPRIRDRKLPMCMNKASHLVMELVGAREGEAPIQAETTTGADGTFVLEGLPAGPQALWALGEHGAMAHSGIPAGSEGVELVLDEGFLLSSTVMGEGAPLAGASVTLLSIEPTRFFDTTTGTDGTFRFGPLPRGSYFVFAAKDGWLPALTPFDSEGVTLHRPSRLSGRVLSNGAPVPGAEVLMAPGEAIPGDDARRLTADAEGRFSVVLPAIAHTFSASLDGRYALAQVAAGTAWPEVVLELGSAPCVEGTVSDDSGRPVAGASVLMYPPRTYDTKLRTVTGADGHYRLGPVEPGTWALTAEAPGYLDLPQAEELELGPGSGRVDLTLERAVSVTGRVTDAEGRPLAGIQLEFVRPLAYDSVDLDEPQEGTWTDEDGRFVVDAPEPGDYRIDVLYAPLLEASFPVRAPSRDVHLTLRPGASVEGTVVDARGLPLEGFYVEPQDPEGEEDLELRRGAHTDAKGRFHLRGVKPGRYLLLASRETSGLTLRASLLVELAEGVRTDVELRMAPERMLSGVVVDGSGQPVEGAFVRVRPPQADAPVWKREGRHGRHGPPKGVETGPDGRFTLRGLTEAEYDVSAWKPGHLLAPERSTGGTPRAEGHLLRIGADTAEVRLVLARKDHIVGRLVDPGGAPVTSFQVNRLPVEDPGGAFAVPRDAMGDEPLVFEADGLSPRVLRRESREGSDGDLDLGVVRMSRGRKLRGRVVDAETSEPVSDASLLPHTRPTGPEGRSLSLLPIGTAEDGTFEIPALDLEAFTLTVSAPEYREQQLTLAPEQEEVTVRLDPGARVEVTVKDRQGRPRAASVEFDTENGPGASAIAHKGRLVLRGLEPGLYTVRLEPESPLVHRFPTFLPQRVTVPASGHVQVHFQEQEAGAAR